MYGGYGDCTAFATKGANYDTYGHMLTEMGYHKSGNQLLYNGYTGEQIYSEIFIGPTYYMRLKHMVKDKINYRATGKRNFLTRQTNQGRANDGGLKIGEMERDGIMAHGLSYFLNESYMVRGDQYFMAVCNKSGTIAIYNPDRNLFLSPFADGPLVFNKNVEGQEILNAISKFGRSFSIIRIPFALKLLIQELQVMNIQMRIITEENIDQLTNLSFQSRNIDKLLHIDHGEDDTVQRDIKEIVENYKTQMVNKMRNIDADVKNKNKIIVDVNVEPQSLEGQPAVMPSPDYAPYSPYSPDSMTESGIASSVETPDYYAETILEDGTKMVGPKYNFPDDLGYYYLNLPKEEKIALETKTFEEKVEYLNNVKMTKNNQAGGGSINIFPNNPNMNAAFNMLSGESQAKILQMSEGEREIVMREIIRKTARQTENIQTENNIDSSNTQQSGGTLNPYFEALPVKTQLEVLQGGYKSVSSEFSQLAGKVNTPLVTIVRPPSIQQRMSEQFPLLAVDKNTDTTSDNTTTNDTTSNDTSSNDSNSNTTTSDSTTRKITF